MKKKGKGLSFDQKKQKMLAIFHKTKDVFNYQQIEKASIKVGIPFPIVKQILQSLKADSLVQCEKIGAGVFYWSFPSRAYQTMTNRLQATKKQIGDFKQQIEILKEDIEEAKVGREQTDKRAELCEQLQDLIKEKNKLDIEIEKLIRFDPQRYELLVKQNNELKSAANAEIDNLEQIKKYIKKNQIGVTNEQIEECYGIPVNLEYYQ